MVFKNGPELLGKSPSVNPYIPDIISKCWTDGVGNGIDRHGDLRIDLTP